MSNITRISADYRAGGLERAVVGFDYDTGEWTVETGTCTEKFDPSTFTVTETHRFHDDRAASAFMRDGDYR